MAVLGTLNYFLTANYLVLFYLAALLYPKAEIYPKTFLQLLYLKCIYLNISTKTC